MKKIILAVILCGLAATARAFDGPYFTVWPTPSQIGHPQTSLGAILSSRGAVQNPAFTNLSVVYHAADPKNSLIPEAYQAYLPAESWSLLNLGYGGGEAGLGSSINLAATVQGYAAEAFQASSKPGLQAFGAAIKPGASPLAINAGPEWSSTVIRNSTFLPINQWRLVPGWFVGAAYKF